MPLKMVDCPTCGVSNSLRRDTCYGCGQPLSGDAEGNDPPVKPVVDPAERSYEHAWAWYVVGGLAVLWVLLAPLNSLMNTMTVAAIGIGAAAGTFVAAAFRQSFPDRNTRMLRVVVGIATAWIAWQITVSLRGL